MLMHPSSVAKGIDVQSLLRIKLIVHVELYKAYYLLSSSDVRMVTENSRLSQA